MLSAPLPRTTGTGVQQVEAVMIKKYNSKHSEGGFIFTALISLFDMIFMLITYKGGLLFPPKLVPYGVIFVIHSDFFGRVRTVF